MTLPLFLSRSMLIRVLWVLLAFTALLQLLDMLDNSTTVLERGEGIGGLLKFMGLRMPSIVLRLIPLAVLMGTVMAFFNLVQNNETIALRAAGLTPYRLVLMLVPLALAIGLLHFLLADQVAPRTERSFLQWWGAEQATTSDSDMTTHTIWARTTGSVIRIGKYSAKARILGDITIFNLDVDGRVRERIFAARATRVHPVWALEKVERFPAADGTRRLEKLDTLDWPTPLKPSNIIDLATPTDAVPTKRSSGVLSGRWIGSRAPDYYQTRLHRAYAVVFVPLVMLLLAAPVIRGVRRTSTTGRGILIAMVSGFAFLLTDGIFAALGEAGLIPALVAAWGPLIIFGSLGLWTMLTLEK